MHNDSKMNLLIFFGKTQSSGEGEAMTEQLYASSFFKIEFPIFKKNFSALETK